MRKKQFCLSIIILVAVILSPALSVFATESAPWPPGPEVASASAVVMDFDSGTVVYDKNGTDPHFPASITKIMTALVALENSQLDDKVTFSYDSVHSLEKGSSSISRDVDEVMTMEECIYGLMLESANECGNAIAEHVGGSIEGFAKMMNDKAKALGCVNTHFANPHGLHNPDHYTCAYDMALIARAAYENPTFALITGTKSYTIPPTNKHAEPTPLNNHHAMLHYYRTNKHIYENCVGGKTGYTSDALSTLVTYAKKDGMTLIVVTMCVPGSGHYLDTRGLFDYFFTNLQSVSVSKLNQDAIDVNSNLISRLVSTDEIPYEVDTNTAIILPVGADSSKVTSEFEKGDGKNASMLGRIVFNYMGKVVGYAPVIGKEIASYPFRNVMSDDNKEVTQKDDFVVINVLKIAGIVVGGILALALVIFIFIKTSQGIRSARRRRIENRDPHMNLRRIKRRRRNRRTKGH